MIENSLTGEVIKKMSESSNNTVDKSKETRQKILISSFSEIYKRGFQAASLNNILKNTGITKGALYHHFQNKVELGYAVVDEVIREAIFLQWIQPLETSDDPITALTEMLMHSGSLMSEEEVRLGCPLNNLAQEMSPIDEGFRNRITGVYDEWQEALESAFDRGKDAGNMVSTVDSNAEALLFVATIEGCMGFAKSVQKLDTLMTCGKGLVDRLESLRPTNKL